MVSRTWPYGTRKSVVVQEVQVGFLVCYEEASQEAFILVGDKSEAKPGDTGYIEFKQGGPTGGFWEFHKE